MTKTNKKEMTPVQQEALLNTLRTRFEKNMNRHKSFNWTEIETRLKARPEKLWSLYRMEETNGEPDVTAFDKSKDEFIFCDCAAESPKGRRSICYDQEALDSRKENKPKHSAVGMAAEMGIDLLTEEQYREMQQFGNYDTKTSSWLKTPTEIRKHGGAIFGDYRYGQVFMYHNGADSYYASRGFRGMLRV